MVKQLKNNKGITLIALVVTITVMVILAGVAISNISGKDGVVHEATDARDDTNGAAIKESIEVAVLTAYANEQGIDLDVLENELRKLAGNNNIEVNQLPVTVTIGGIDYTIDEDGNVTTDGDENIETNITVESNVTIDVGDTENVIENETKNEVIEDEIVQAESISIAGNTSTGVGRTIKLTAEILPNNTTDKTVTWTSSDETIATVDSTGVVTGVANGTVTITATINGKQDTYSIEIGLFDISSIIYLEKLNNSSSLMSAGIKSDSDEYNDLMGTLYFSSELLSETDIETIQSGDDLHRFSFVNDTTVTKYLPNAFEYTYIYLWLEADATSATRVSKAIRIEHAAITSGTANSKYYGVTVE